MEIRAEAGWFVRDSYLTEQPRVVAAHPAVPDTVFAGGRDGLVRSLDAGNTWQPVVQIDGPVKQVLFANSSVIYVIADQLWRSRDVGETWEVVATEPCPPLSIAVDHANPERLFLLTKSGLFRSDDSATTFARLTPALFFGVGISVVTGALGTRDLYVVYHGGAQFSRDHGKTWSAMVMSSPSGTAEVDGRAMFEMVLTEARAIAVKRNESARQLACGVVRIVAWDGLEVVSGPGIFVSNSKGAMVTGMHENGAFMRPGPPPDCLFAALDPSKDGGWWIGTARELLYAPAGEWPVWSEVKAFRDVAAYQAAFSSTREPQARAIRSKAGEPATP